MDRQQAATVFRVEPLGFSPVLGVAACYLECDGKLLLLKRTPGKSEGGKWGVPGGKIEQGETSSEAIIRELREETQITIDQENLKFVGTLFIRKKEFDYLYYMYSVKVKERPVICLNHEHVEFLWVPMDEIGKLPVMAGGLETYCHFKALVNGKEVIRKPFYFVRHGETAVNADPDIKRVDDDLPLNERGRKQAATLSDHLKSLQLMSVCCSPLQRAVETKQILVSSLDMKDVMIDQLSECKARVWTEMVKLEEGSQIHLSEDVTDYLLRVTQGINSALHNCSPTLIVAHGGVHWALCYSLAITNHPWKIGNCKLVHFQPEGSNGWKAEIIV